MSHHVSEAVVECPLASLGLHIPRTLDQSYHHPLSTSPLDPQAYQILRKSQESPIFSPNEFKRSNNATDSNTFPPQRNVSTVNGSSVILSRRDLQRIRNQTYTAFDTTDTSAPPVALPRTLVQNSTSDEDTQKYLMCHKISNLALRDDGTTSDDAVNNYDSHNFSYQNYQNIIDPTDFNYYNVSTSTQINNSSPKLRRRPSSPDTSGSDRYFLDRSKGSPAFTSRNAMTAIIKPSNDVNRFKPNGINEQTTTTMLNSFLDSSQLVASERFSPSHDQGYHTLNTPSPPSGQQLSLWNNQTNIIKRVTPKRGEGFNRLPNHLVIRIFEWLDSTDLCNLTQVCKRFETLVWNPILWKNITIKGE